MELAGRIKAALEATDAAVFYIYPSSFAALPALSYAEAERASLLDADDEPLLVSVRYTVDIWARTFSEACALGSRAARLLKGIGFAVENDGDQYDKALNVCRRTLRCQTTIMDETEE